MTKIKICIESGCKNAQTTKDYCRLHYLKNWKIIKEKAQKRAADQLNKYVDGICKKYPERFMDVIRRDLRSEKDKDDTPAGDSFAPDLTDEMLEDLGFHDEGNIDKLISQIKTDKEF